MGKLETKYLNKIGIDEYLFTRNTIPKDYHCKCKYCREDKFLGEIYNTKTDQYYSQLARYSYYPKLKEKHLCPGHWQGYRYGIHLLTKDGDTILDPCVGTGSAIIESNNNNRRGIGVELEFSNITKQNIEFAVKKRKDFLLIEGDSREINFKKLNEKVDLVITGPPYPTLGTVSSDAPDRGDDSFNYKNEKNIGILKEDSYYYAIYELYLNACSILKVDGYFVTIIKDPINKKIPYLLHQKITDLFISTGYFNYIGFYLHKHIPITYSMASYQKRFKEVKIPLYQTAIILKKCVGY